MRSGTKASTRKLALPMGGWAGSASSSTIQVPAGAEADRATGRWIAASGPRGGTVSRNTWPLGRLIRTCAGTSAGCPAASRSSAIR